MCLVDVSNLIENFKFCSTLEMVHAICLKNLKARQKGIIAKMRLKKKFSARY